MPAGLPGYETYVVGEESSDIGPGSSTLVCIPEIQIQLRSHDHGMGGCFPNCLFH